MERTRKSENGRKRPAVSIVMTYFDRSQQLQNTLRSFSEHGYGTEVEVIVVDDGSIRAPAAKPEFATEYSLKILYLPASRKWYTNPCIPLNVGIEAASGRLVILQNAECCHVGNVVRHALENTTEQDYLSYACYSIDKDTLSRISNPTFNISEFSREGLANERPMADGGNGWYNHSRVNPVGYHFCASLTKTNLVKLGFFDRRYAKGVAYDDAEFLERIHRLPLKIRIVDTPFVVHQFHGTTSYAGRFSRKLVRRNRELFENYTKRGGGILRLLGVELKLSFKEPLRHFFVNPVFHIVRAQIRKALSIFPREKRSPS